MKGLVVGYWEWPQSSKNGRRKKRHGRAVREEHRTKLCTTKPRLNTMRESLSEFLFSAAQEMRRLALRAPDIGNELRRFADDLESEAVELRKRDQGPDEDAA
jgi:hypothetical protein